MRVIYIQMSKTQKILGGKKRRSSKQSRRRMKGGFFEFLKPKQNPQEGTAPAVSDPTKADETGKTNDVNATTQPVVSDTKKQESKPADNATNPSSSSFLSKLNIFGFGKKSGGGKRKSRRRRSTR